MKATDLSGTHLGQTVTATIGQAVVKDVLVGIDSSADLTRNGLFAGQEDLITGRGTSRSTSPLLVKSRSTT